MLRLLKKEIKTLKLVGVYQKVYLLLCYKTYCNSYIANSSVALARVVACWPVPEPMDPGILGTSLTRVLQRLNLTGVHTIE